jgi:hypothetical protein
VANSENKSEYTNKASKNTSQTYHQLPYYHIENQPLPRNDQEPPKDNVLSKSLADLFNHLSINEPEVSNKSRQSKKRKRKSGAARRKERNERILEEQRVRRIRNQNRNLQPCQHQGLRLQEQGRTLEPTRSQRQIPLRVTVKIEIQQR